MGGLIDVGAVVLAERTEVLVAEGEEAHSPQGTGLGFRQNWGGGRTYASNEPPDPIAPLLVEGELHLVAPARGLPRDSCEHVIGHPLDRREILS